MNLKDIGHEINSIRFLVKNGIGTYIENHNLMSYKTVNKYGKPVTVKEAIEDLIKDIDAKLIKLNEVLNEES